MRTKKRKVIALLFNSYDREVEMFKIGVLQYARPTKDGAFIHCSQNNILGDLARTDGLFAGGIGEFGRPDLWAAAKKAPFPVINLYGGHELRGLPTVGVDDREIGRMAARHLGTMETVFTPRDYRFYDRDPSPKASPTPPSS